jgi:hypothetical protein
MEFDMSKLTMIALAAMALAIPSQVHAQANDDATPNGTAKPSCVLNADGKPGKNNQGAGAGNGGKGGTIALNGKKPDGCVSANGGNGGNGNSGSNSGNGGAGGTIKF